MKKILTAIALAAMLSASAVAADDNPALLLSMPCPAPVPAPAACEPPPPPAPVCETPPPPACAPAPAPVCASLPPACPTPPPLCDAPATASAQKREATVNQYRVVPVKKKVWEEETYTVNETRTQVHNEVRTKVVKPNAPRLARVMRNDGVELVVHKDKPKVVPYMKEVKTTYQVPVAKTRKVAREVEEYKVVQDRRLIKW